MRCFGYISSALFATAILAAGPAFANSCQAGNLTCPTTMPVGGYCECTAHGKTEPGTVTSKPAPGQHYNSTAGGCGANPKSAGCR